MPSATGTSIAMRPSRRLCHAAPKKGPAEKASTGTLSSQLAHCSRRSMSGARVPGAATYSGVEYIITCIMQNSATKSCQSARRWACWRKARAEPAVSGTAP